MKSIGAKLTQKKVFATIDLKADTFIYQLVTSEMHTVF